MAKRPRGEQRTIRIDRVTPRSAAPTVRPLEGRRVTAAWGSPTRLAPFLAATGPDGARDSAGLPVAEVWFGAHERNPSIVIEAEGRREISDIDPIDRPTFLVKLIAAAMPLSIQVHPDTRSAEAGYAADDAEGIPLGSSGRRFVDRSGKPELLLALGPMRVLCGLRAAGDSRALLSIVAPRGADLLLEALAHGDVALGGAVAALLRADPATRAGLLASVAEGARALLDSERHEDFIADPVRRAAVRLAGLALDLQSRFPDDAGTLVALLLEDLDLEPGDALYVAPGTPHAYLSGLGVEVMASSDNVLRGGMTVKRIDVDAFLDVLDPSAVGPSRVGTFPRRADGTGWRRRITPADAFLVDEASVDGSLLAERSGLGPGILLCLEGELIVRGGDGSVARLAPGSAALLASGLDPVEIVGRGRVLHASAGQRGPVATVLPQAGEA